MNKLFLAIGLLFATATTFAQTDTLSMSASNKKENWLYLGDRSNPQPIRNVELRTEVVVVGGGMSGISAAVAAARQGASVVFIQDRPVLGGNASSEIRMTVNGAPFERETGVVEELLIENLLHNPQHSHHVWDHILYNYVTSEPVGVTRKNRGIKLKVLPLCIIKLICRIV